MIRKIFVAIVALTLLGLNATAAPRQYGAWGTATDVNTTVTSPFNPSYGCVYNDSATDEIYVDVTDGVATTASGSTNIKVLKGEKYCWGSTSPNVSESFTIGIICAAGKTVAYRVSLFRGR